MFKQITKIRQNSYLFFFCLLGVAFENPSAQEPVLAPPPFFFSMPSPEIKAMTDPTANREESATPEALAHFPQADPQINTSSALEKVAILLPLSGEHQNLGNHVLQGIFLAYFKKPTPSHFKVHIYDTESSEQGLTKCLAKIRAEKIPIVIGPIFKSETLIVQKFPFGFSPLFFSFSNDTSLSSKTTLILGITPSQQIQAILTYIERKHPRRRRVAILPDTPIGLAFEQSLIHADVLSKEKIFKLKKLKDLKDRPDLITALTQDHTPCLILVLGWGLESIPLSAQLKSDLPKHPFIFIGDMGFSHPQIRSDPVLQNSAYPNFDPTVEKFTLIYVSLFKETPHLLAYYGYDLALSLLSTAEKIHHTAAAFPLLFQDTQFKTLTGINQYNIETGSVSRTLKVRDS